MDGGALAPSFGLAAPEVKLLDTMWASDSCSSGFGDGVDACFRSATIVWANVSLSLALVWRSYLFTRKGRRRARFRANRSPLNDGEEAVDAVWVIN